MKQHAGQGKVMGRPSQRSTVVVLSERHPGERRVSIVPSDAERLKAYFDVVVETGAGLMAGFQDDDYTQASAKVHERELAISIADIVVGVRPPDLKDFAQGTFVISLGGREASVAQAAATAGVVHLGLERLPRVSRAQSMDVLSSQASIAGYAAVLEGARQLDIMLPMMTTAAGIIRPAKMIALGAGVAGLQAIATARRLGAVVYGFDVREAAREQVESLGAEFVFPEVPVAGSEAAGGYAAAQSVEQQASLRRALAKYLVPMGLIVTSAQIPGRRAPLLIDEEGLAALKPGTVVVDMAAETGGNVTVTVPDTVVRHGHVIVVGSTNLPSTVATDASRLFSGNLRALLQHMVQLGGLQFLAGDEVMDALIGDQELPAVTEVEA